MNLGICAGKILAGLCGIFLFGFMYEMISVGNFGKMYIYGGGAFSSFVFGVLCHEIGNCAASLEKTERASYSSLKLHQDILSEIKKIHSRQDIKEVQCPQEEKKCAKCGKPIANDATTCVHCGESMKWGW